MVGTTIAVHDMVVHHHYYNLPADMETSENNALYRTLRYHYLFKIYMPVYRWLHTPNAPDSSDKNANTNSARVLSTEDYMRRKRAYRKAYSVAGLPSAECLVPEEVNYRQPTFTQSNINLSQHQNTSSRIHSPRMSPSKIRKLRSCEKLRNCKTLSIPEEPELDQPTLPQKVISQDSGYNGSCMGLADPCGHCDQCNKSVYSDGEALYRSMPKKRDLIRRHRSCPEKRTSFVKIFDSVEETSYIVETQENTEVDSKITEPLDTVLERQSAEDEVFAFKSCNSNNISDPKFLNDKKPHYSDSACSADTELSDATVIERWHDSDTNTAVLNVGTDTSENMSLLSQQRHKLLTTHNSSTGKSDSETIVKKVDSLLVGSNQFVQSSSRVTTELDKTDDCVGTLKSVVNMCCDLCSCPGGLEVCGDISSAESAVIGGDMNANVTGCYNCSKCNRVKSDIDIIKASGYDGNICKPKVPEYKLLKQGIYTQTYSTSKPNHVCHQPDQTQSFASSSRENTVFRGKTQVHLSNKIKHMKLQTSVSYDNRIEGTKTHLSSSQYTDVYPETVHERTALEKSNYYRSNSAKLIYLQQLQKAYKIGVSQSEEFVKSTKINTSNSQKPMYARNLHKINGVVQTTAGAYSHRKNNRKLQQSKSFSVRQLSVSMENNRLKSRKGLSLSLDEVNSDSQRESGLCNGSFNNNMYTNSKHTTSMLQSRKNERQEILRKLAMVPDEESGFGSQDRALKKTNMQSRYQGGQSLQLCFMNDPEQTANKTTTKQKPSDSQIATSSVGPASVPGVMTEEIEKENKEKDADLISKQQKLQQEATIALAQVPSMAKMQLQIEKKVKKKSPIAEITGIQCLGDGKILQLTLPVIQEMNVAQLQVVVNDLLSQIESLNMELVNMLIERDDLHMEQDSMLVDIEDLHRRAEELADRVQIAEEIPKKSKKDKKK